MEYDEIIKHLGEFGTYQKRILALIFIPIIYNSFSTPVSNFLVGQQLHRCQIPGIDNDSYGIQDEVHQRLINETIPLKADGSHSQCSVYVNGTEVGCSKWVYDQSTFTLTIISQFNLVCAEEIWHSHAVFAYFFGHIFSAIVVCPLADVVGRKLSLCIGLIVQFATNVCMPFSPNVVAFTIFRFLDGTSGLMCYQVPFIIGMELVGPSKRLQVGTVVYLMYCFGELVLVLLAYFIRDWRWLQLTLAVPMSLSLFFLIPNLLPESIRWLISRGRSEDAWKIIQKAAKVNKVQLPVSSETLKDVNYVKESSITILKGLVQSSKLRIRWAIVASNWFAISFIYYGMTVNIGELGGNLYLNFTIAVIAESIGVSLCFLLNITGRKPMHLVLMFGAGTACLLCIFPILFAEPSFNWITVALALIGRLGISGAFAEIFIYTGEIFPTVVRSFVMGTCSFWARVGSGISPYVYLMADGRLGKALPLVTYGAVTFIVASLAILLPETRHRRLLEIVKDAEHEENLRLNNSDTAEVTRLTDNVTEQ